MNRDQEQTSFHTEATGDGSPTLRLSGGGESMHHSGGAASETCYIYQSVMAEAYKILPSAQTCVVGLGLGYIEICWALVSLNQNLTNPQLRSFEICKELRDGFSSWLVNLGYEETNTNLYSQVCHSLQRILKVPTDEVSVRKTLQEAFKVFPVQEDLHSFVRKKEFNPLQYQSHIICYDAFSSKTNSELWEESFLHDFVSAICAQDCVWTTYACTGTLKKVLSESGFTVIKRPGFQGKRDSTLALRGIFKQDFPRSLSRTF